MTDKFHNKYRIPSARCQNWDYSTNAAYFITICTKNREHHFGRIENGKMYLSHVGVLADVFWHEIKNHAKNVEFDSFVVMPNHIHGILILDGNDNENNNHCNENEHDNNNGNDDHAHDVETRHALSLHSTNATPGQQRFQNQGVNTVSSIIGSYKSAISKHANRLGFEIEWQSRFHDHIIRDDAEFSRIAEYIETNVVNWTTDKFFLTRRS